MTCAMASDTYILGHTDRERRRLLLQASILNPLTKRFLRNAGIAVGMRVLDLGCGAGDVALLAAELTGPTGEVVGIDVAEPSLQIARQRAEAADHRNIRFGCQDLATFRTDRPFDAVVGRHILIHTAEPLEVLRSVASFLTPGGIVAFEEYDLSRWTVGYPEVPLAARLAQAIIELFHRASPHPDMGPRLHHLVQEAGFSNPRTTAECVVDGGPYSLFYEWFAETVRSALPSAADDTLAARLRSDFLEARASLASPVIFSTFATL
jgi:ubiquinone/menaquinone biosynthesis C-methylase UbiE